MRWLSRACLSRLLPVLLPALVAGCGGGGGGGGTAPPAPAGDTTPPRVIAVSASDGATNVSVATAVQVTFSEPVRNVSAATFQLRAGATPVSGTVTIDGLAATFVPAAALAPFTTHTATVTTGVTDLANNALASNYSWSFTTGTASGAAAPAVTLPTVTSIGETSATMNGVVSSNGLPTECWFEYGADPALGTYGSTARLAVDPGAASRSVADTASGLAPGTAYYCRLCASNSLGTSRSAIVGFTTYACLNCHGGVDGTWPGVNGAPVVTRYWRTSGHGRPGPGSPVGCDGCHDVGSPVGAHPADGSGVFNTLSWPGKAADTANANTSHLKGFFFPPSPLSTADYAIAFDNACGNRVGCHARADGTRVAAPMTHTKDGVMEFGTLSTAANPKLYSWYSQNSYPEDFYKSQCAWVMQDLTNSATGPPHYGICVSCHDPHGTGTTDQKASGGNAMLRGNWKTESSQFCTGPCHR